jgi:hypothetical protein
MSLVPLLNRVPLDDDVDVRVDEGGVDNVVDDSAKDNPVIGLSLFVGIFPVGIGDDNNDGAVVAVGGVANFGGGVTIFRSGDKNVDAGVLALFVGDDEVGGDAINEASSASSASSSLPILVADNGTDMRASASAIELIYKMT